MIRRGGCLCGAVRYEVAGEPLRAGLCHCGICRRVASAAALPFAVFPAAAFRLLRGTPAEHRSSPPVTRGFCAGCGSPLTYRSAEEPDLVDVMAGSLDDPDSITPQYHVWMQDKAAWDVVADGLPAYPEARPAPRS